MWAITVFTRGVFGGLVPDQLLRAVLYPETVALVASAGTGPRRPTTAPRLLTWLMTNDPWSDLCLRGLQHESPLLEFRQRAWAYLTDAT